MNETISTTVTIRNSLGLHMRPAYLLAQTAAQFDCKIELIKDDQRIDGKSILSIMTLGAAQGTEVSVEATGTDADRAIETIHSLIESGFPETPKSEAEAQEEDAQ